MSEAVPNKKLQRTCWIKCQGHTCGARPLNRIVRQRGKVYKDHARMVPRSKGIRFFALRKCGVSEFCGQDQ